MLFRLWAKDRDKLLILSLGHPSPFQSASYWAIFCWKTTPHGFIQLHVFMKFLLLTYTRERRLEGSLRTVLNSCQRPIHAPWCWAWQSHGSSALECECLSPPLQPRNGWKVNQVWKSEPEVSSHSGYLLLFFLAENRSESHSSLKPCGRGKWCNCGHVAQRRKAHYANLVLHCVLA